MRKKQFKRRLCLFLAAAALFALMPLNVLAEGSLSNFKRNNTYEAGHFKDVTEKDWFSKSVADAYEFGIMNGEATDWFHASGYLTTEQAIIMAARLHSIYYTGKEEFREGIIWYDSYIRYALDNGIVDTRYDIKSYASRALFADILSRALPESELTEINNVPFEAIPDLKADSGISPTVVDSIYKLYRAGVLGGSDEKGTFYPRNGITRAEAAAIAVRMADPAQRKTLSLSPVKIYSGPDVPERETAGDDFFANSAILGNSLVEGLRVYGKMATLDYYAATGASVTSVLSSLVPALSTKNYDRIYIELGINEIGYQVSSFIRLYGQLLDTLKQAEPGADIYIISVLPVSKDKSEASPYYNMDSVNAYNDALYTLASQKQCYYLNVCPEYLDEEGYLHADWTPDGIHLQASYYSVWENYMRTHYV